MAAAAGRILSQKEEDMQMMLATSVHLGTKNCNFQMERCVFKRRTDGVYIINIGKTWEKLQMATRVIVAIENPKDIVVQSARPYGQRVVLKFAQYTGIHAIAGRHTPGTFTKQLQTTYSEPHLLILTDPRTDHQSIKEVALGNIPTIAFYDIDSDMRHVDMAIPANNEGKHSIGCLFWMLARMVLQMRTTIPPSVKWDVMFLMLKSFGKVVSDAKELEEYRREDLSRSLLRMISNNIDPSAAGGREEEGDRRLKRGHAVHHRRLYRTHNEKPQGPRSPATVQCVVVGPDVQGTRIRRLTKGAWCVYRMWGPPWATGEKAGQWFRDFGWWHCDGHTWEKKGRIGGGRLLDLSHENPSSLTMTCLRRYLGGARWPCYLRLLLRIPPVKGMTLVRELEKDLKM